MMSILTIRPVINYSKQINSRVYKNNILRYLNTTSKCSGNTCGSDSDKKGTGSNAGEPGECNNGPCDPCSCCQSPPCDCNPSTPTMYDCRKYGHCLPNNSVMPYFEPLPCIPTGVFRCTVGEKLGPGADKCSCYKNPEYFSFQHMTYYDMHLIMRNYRNPSAKTGRKP